jgi:hypothetical protein
MQILLARRSPSSRRSIVLDIRSFERVEAQRFMM